MLAVLKNHSSQEIICEKDALDVVIEIRFDGTIWFVCKHENANANAYFNSEFYEMIFPNPASIDFR